MLYLVLHSENRYCAVCATSRLDPAECHAGYSKRGDGPVAVRRAARPAHLMLDVEEVPQRHGPVEAEGEHVVPPDVVVDGLKQKHEKKTE